MTFFHFEATTIIIISSNTKMVLFGLNGLGLVFSNVHFSAWQMIKAIGKILKSQNNGDAKCIIWKQSNYCTKTQIILKDWNWYIKLFTETQNYFTETQISYENLNYFTTTQIILQNLKLFDEN